MSKELVSVYVSTVGHGVAETWIPLASRLPHVVKGVGEGVDGVSDEVQPRGLCVGGAAEGGEGGEGCG